MADLPRPARIYIVVVLVVAAAAVVVTLILAPPRVDRAPLALLLLLCATIAQQFKVKSPKHQSYYPTTIFFFAAATLLHPGYVVVIVLVAHAVEWLRVRSRWYIQAFNMANFLLCSIAAGAIFGLGESGHANGRAVLFAALAGVACVGLNHLLTALVVTWARGAPISRSGTLDRENVGTDLTLLAV